MQIIPVLDLCGGVVVHAVAGDRDRYRPVQSGLCESANPISVARGFRERFGLNEIYIADLDGIAGRDVDWENIKRLAEDGFELWLDAGRQVLTHDVRPQQTILATEWLAARPELDTAVLRLGAERVVLSLDFRGGRLLSRVPEWQGIQLDSSLIALVDSVWKIGVRRFLLLDVLTVGSSFGPAEHMKSVCRELCSNYPSVHLSSGGGVRCIRDVTEMADAGCSAMLVATALHDGSIAAGELADL